MRLLSLNVWGGLLHEELLAYLVDTDADVYCLQEVPRTRSSRSKWLTYRHDGVEIRQRAHLYDELRVALPDHDGFFCPAARGELSDGGTPCWEEFGLATFVRSTTPVIGHALDFVHGDYAAHGFGAHPRARNAHAVRVFDYEADRATTIVQMHGIREEVGKADTAARDAQAEALVQLITRIWRPGEPLVVCGDFNVLPDSRLFDALAVFDLTNLITSHGFTDTRTSHYRRAGRFADYLLVSDGVDVLDFEVVHTPEVSDHRPLLVTVR